MCRFGGYEPKASGVGEVLSAENFYSYEAKYFNAESKNDACSPEFPDGILEKVRDCAERISKAVDGYGLARVDFFLEKDSNQIIFNEINTMPGFTGIGMYPMLFGQIRVWRSVR